MINRFFESLEQRSLLSADVTTLTLNGEGNLLVVGTHERDGIIVRIDKVDPSKLDLSSHDHVTQFDRSAVKRVMLVGGEGNDVLVVDESNGAIGVPVYMMGGAGDDTLIGGSGNDSLNGDAGNDRIFGRKGNDTEHGGAGNDRIDGEDGADSLLGDAGNDRVDGGAGNDKVDGGGGSDHCFGGSGKDRFSSHDKGHERVDENKSDLHDQIKVDDKKKDDGNKPEGEHHDDSNVVTEHH